MVAARRQLDGVGVEPRRIGGQAARTVQQHHAGPARQSRPIDQGPDDAPAADVLDRLARRRVRQIPGARGL